MSTSTTTVTASSQVQLSKDHVGIVHSDNIPEDSFNVATRLLQHNHDKNHIFWRDLNGHNHMAHLYLSLFALGATPEQLQQGFDDNQPIHRAPPAIDETTIAGFAEEGKFLAALSKGDQYTNYLVFFEREMEKKGWKQVVQEYVFSRTPVAEAVLSLLYEGAYHPIIHFGLGIEFEQPSIIAEGLAQAAAHTNVGIDKFLFDSEKLASRYSASELSKKLVDLLKEARANDTIHHAAHWTDFANKINHGVFGRAGTEIAELASQFRVTPDTLDRHCAEVINIAAYMAGAAQRKGKGRKIDFFYMHNVTSSIFFSVFMKQDWLSVEDKVRLVEWKGRLDLVWYAASGCPELNVDDVANYQATLSKGMGWDELYKAIVDMHDDGHVAKFVRALRNGMEVGAPFENGESGDAFPLKGNMWLQLARMAYDTTLGLSPEGKWIWGAGFDQPWGGVPGLE
jgi:hypothetical protein